MRDFINKHGKYVAIGLLALALIAFLIFKPGFQHLPTQAFFIDEETGAQSIRPLSDIPPLPGKDGKDTVVLAYEYSTDGGKTGKIAYYIKYTPEMKAKLESLPPQERLTYDASGGQLVRLPDPGSKWATLRSDQGQAISTGNIHFDGANIQRFFP